LDYAALAKLCHSFSQNVTRQYICRIYASGRGSLPPDLWLKEKAAPVFTGAADIFVPHFSGGCLVETTGA